MIELKRKDRTTKEKYVPVGTVYEDGHPAVSQMW